MSCGIAATTVYPSLLSSSKSKFAAAVQLPSVGGANASSRFTMSADWMPGQPRPPYLDGSAPGYALNSLYSWTHFLTSCLSGVLEHILIIMFLWCVGFFSDFGFDPLRLGEVPENLERFKESEIYHCRWAMLAVVSIYIHTHYFWTCFHALIKSSETET